MNCKLVLCTCPDKATAEQLAQSVVEQQLAACVSIIPQLVSIYQWQGKVETANENLLLIKTTAENYQLLEAFIKVTHPYEIPEIIAIDISQGLPAYLNWIVQSVNT